MPSNLRILASGTPVAITAEDSSWPASSERHRIGIGNSSCGPRKIFATSLRWCADHRTELKEMGQTCAIVAVETYEESDKPHELLNSLSPPPTQTFWDWMPNETVSTAAQLQSADSIFLIFVICFDFPSSL